MSVNEIILQILHNIPTLMSVNEIILQILHNIPTILVSIGGSWGLRECFDWLKRRNLQKQVEGIQKNLQSQQAKITLELEITKGQCQQEIQTHYLQTQLKTSSLYKSYPIVHRAFKEAEGSVYSLFCHSYGSQKEAYDVWCGLSQKLAEHSIFLNDSLRDACILAKDTLMNGIRSYASMDEGAKNTLMSTIHKQVDSVSGLMRALLLEEKTKIQAT